MVTIQLWAMSGGSVVFFKGQLGAGSHRAAAELIVASCPKPTLLPGDGAEQLQLHAAGTASLLCFPAASPGPQAELLTLCQAHGAEQRARSSSSLEVCACRAADVPTQDHQRCHHSVCSRGEMWSLLGAGCAGTQQESQEIQTLGIMEQSVCCFANIP